eukprot:TRINITY_DN54926_c0_g1_i1.p1 TRINITY_DN54926_c0_g1~~TRINITY_DN54926_c0_g1_i1.p1  ORF type:complete len:634 (-),score=108.63 TRINITY_DN54926_c0_g1_i1:84-1985(-)
MQPAVSNHVAAEFVDVTESPSRRHTHQYIDGIRGGGDGGATDTSLTCELDRSPSDLGQSPSFTAGSGSLSHRRQTTKVQRGRVFSQGNLRADSCVFLEEDGDGSSARLGSVRQNSQRAGSGGSGQHTQPQNHAEGGTAYGGAIFESIVGFAQDLNQHDLRAQSTAPPFANKEVEVATTTAVSSASQAAKGAAAALLASASQARAENGLRRFEDHQFSPLEAMQKARALQTIISDSNDDATRLHELVRRAVEKKVAKISGASATSPTGRATYSSRPEELKAAISKRRLDRGLHVARRLSIASAHLRDCLPSPAPVPPKSPPPQQRPWPPSRSCDAAADKSSNVRPLPSFSFQTSFASAATASSSGASTTSATAALQQLPCQQPQQQPEQLGATLSLPISSKTPRLPPLRVSRLCSEDEDAKGTHIARRVGGNTSDRFGEGDRGHRHRQRGVPRIFFKRPRPILGGRFVKPTDTKRREYAEVASSLGLTETDWDMRRHLYRVDVRFLFDAAERKKFRLKDEAATRIQRTWRIVLCPPKYGMLFSQLRLLVVRIQRWWRKCMIKLPKLHALAVSAKRHKKAALIQAIVRGRHIRKLTGSTLAMRNLNRGMEQLQSRLLAKQDDDEGRTHEMFPFQV